MRDRSTWLDAILPILRDCERERSTSGKTSANYNRAPWRCKARSSDQFSMELLAVACRLSPKIGVGRFNSHTVLGHSAMISPHSQSDAPPKGPIVYVVDDAPLIREMLSSHQDLLDAISTALKRDKKRRQDEMNVSEIRARFESLTPREQQLMTLVTGGLLNKQIAVELSLSEANERVRSAAAGNTKNWIRRSRNGQEARSDSPTVPDP